MPLELCEDSDFTYPHLL